MMNIPKHNRAAWDCQVAEGNQWTVPVSSEVTAAARGGEWSVVLTPQKPVPRAWFGELAGKRVVALASGGGQQTPVVYLFDDEEQERTGALTVRHSIPYADTTSLSPERLKRCIESSEALEFGHTLEDQIGGQLEAGFVLHAFFGDRYDHPIDRYINTYAATLAIKA